MVTKRTFIITPTTVAEPGFNAVVTLIFQFSVGINHNGNHATSPRCPYLSD